MNLEKAVYFFQKSLQVSKRHHSFSPAYNNLGLVYLKEKQYELSLSSFEQAIKENPNLLTPLFNLGHLYLKFGNAPEAEKIFRRLYQKNRKDIDVISALGSISLTKGRYQEAITLYKTIPVTDLKRPDIALNYAMALTQTKNSVEAKEVLAMAENHKDWQNYRRSIEKLLE
jgi:tetratricopeptide (TPR) repeat protein